MDQDVERRIRDRAHKIWEEEGRPEGRDVDHWLRAAQEIAAEEHEQSGSSTDSDTAEAEEKPKRSRATRTNAKGEKTAEKGSGKGGEKDPQKDANKAAEPGPKAKRSSKKAG